MSSFALAMRFLCSMHLLILLFLTMMIIVIPLACHAQTTEFVNCSSTIQCGSLQNIAYPFWGVNRASYCGNGEEYQLTCVDGTSLEMTLSGLTYHVLEYDNSTRAVTVARDDYYTDICPQTYLSNVSSISPFSYSNSTIPNNLTLYYGCSTGNFECQFPIPPPTNQSGGPSGVTVGYVMGGYIMVKASDIIFGADASSLDTCYDNVILPVSLTGLLKIHTSATIATVEAALKDGFGLVWPDDDGACQGCIQSGGQCGSDSNNAFACYCSDNSYSSTCPSSLSPSPSPSSSPLSSGGGSNSKLPLILSAVLIPLVLASIACMFLAIRRHNLRRFSPTTSQTGKNSYDVLNFVNGIAPRKYRYSDLKRMTNSFSEKLGQGGFGSVYKGRLKDGRLVAVKILSGSKGSSGEDFFNEVASISRTAHVNVVALLGFCYERKRRGLVYEYMPNGSLNKFITTKGAKDGSGALECKVLYQIALGVARGLEYLHRGCNTRIVHFDIKPHNILLDQDFVPKISDFGLAKLWQGKESMVSMQGTGGTIGYTAPEVLFRNFGGVSHKSDVYSYGMLVLDMVCGRDNPDARVSHSSDVYFPDWIYKEYLQLRKDITLNGITTEEEEEMTRKMIVVSLWCIQYRPSDRPSIKEVIEMLEGSIEALQVPPLKPLQAYPERLAPQLYSATQSSSFSGIEEISILEPEIRAVDSIGAGNNILTHLN